MRAALALATLVVLPGCLGSVSRFDGEWPLAPSLTRNEANFDEIGGGEDAVLLRERNKATSYRIASRTSAHDVTCRADLSRALVRGSSIWRVDERGAWRHSRRDPDDKELAFEAPGARVLAVRGDAIAVATTDVVVVRRDARSKPRAVWSGVALALELDEARDALWVVGSSPSPSIDVVSLADGTIAQRILLPRELETPNVRVILSGSSALVFAHDRPLESALLICPEKQVVRTLRDALERTVARGRSFPDACPPLLVPPVDASEHPSLGDPGGTFGRAAPWPGGRFLLVADRPGEPRPTAHVVEAFDDPDAPPSIAQLSLPVEWPGVVQGLGWDEKGAVITCGAREVRLAPGDVKLEDHRGVGDSLRRGTNVVANLVIAGSELALGAPFGVALGSLAVPFGPPLLLLVPSHPEAGLLCLSAPVWLPFVNVWR